MLRLDPSLNRLTVSVKKDKLEGNVRLKPARGQIPLHEINFQFLKEICCYTRFRKVRRKPKIWYKCALYI